MTEVAVEIDTTSNTKDEQLLQEQLSALQLDNAAMLDEDSKDDVAAEHSDEENLKPAAGKKRGERTEKRREGVLVQRGVTGHVKWFSVMNGYGFIERSDNDKDIFVHKSAIIRSNPKKFFTSLLKDEEVEFDVVTGIKGAEAAAVTGIGGKPVKGFKFVDGRRFRGPPRSERRKVENNGDGPDSEVRKEKHNHDAPAKGRSGRRRYTSDGKTDGSNTEQSEGKADAAPSAPRGRRRRAHGRPSSKHGKKSSDEKKTGDGSVEDVKKTEDVEHKPLEEPKAQSEAQN